VKKDLGGKPGTSQSQPQEHTHNHNFQMGDVTSDNLKRSLYTDPVFHDSFKQQWEKGGYLQN